MNLTIALSPRYLESEKRTKEIRDKLNGLVSQYVPEADGVLIKWDDLTLSNDKGIIIDDQPFVFWKVSFTAQVFKPIEGKIIKGKVHEVQKCYFIAKAMDHFTVTVSIPEALLTDDTIQNIMIEQDIYFKMKGSSEGVYRGELDEECLELTVKSIAQELEANRDDYEYAKDFEY